MLQKISSRYITSGIFSYVSRQSNVSYKRFQSMNLTGLTSVCRNASTSSPATSCRNNEETSRRRCQLFGEEKARQMALVSRVEKIEVKHIGPPEDCTLLMNKNLSTPFNCAMHIGELLMTRSVLALVNGEPWDMHRPLESDCELRFLHFKDEDPTLCNEAFFRTGSFLLGYIAERAFKNELFVDLCSFPRPSVTSGSFIYDVELPLPEWRPTQAELSCLSRIGSRLQYEDETFTRLDVDASVALNIFSDNKYKQAQIPNIAAQSPTGSRVTLYRVKDHVDITRGPLISSTHLIGRFCVTAVHDIGTEDFGRLKRFQGVMLPKQLPVHFWTYDLLCKRAAELNSAPVPHKPSSPPLVGKASAADVAGSS